VAGGGSPQGVRGAGRQDRICKKDNKKGVMKLITPFNLILYQNK